MKTDNTGVQIPTSPPESIFGMLIAYRDIRNASILSNGDDWIRLDGIVEKATGKMTDLIGIN